MIQRSLFVLLFLVSTMASGQENQEEENADSANSHPSFLLGGNIQLNGEQALDEYLYLASGSVNGGYFVTENLLIGAETVLSFGPTSRYYEAVPIVRWYHTLNEHDRMYAGLRGGYGWGTDISVFNGSKKGRYAWLWGGRLGYLSMVSPNVGLDIFAFYNQRNSASQRQDGFFTSLAMTSNFGLGLGLQVFL